MNDEYRIAAYQLRYDLQQASEDSVAAKGLLEEVIDPMFDDYRCNGILEAYAKKNGGDLNKAARAWMEENYNALCTTIYAVNHMISRVTDTLQGMPEVQPVKEA